MCSTKMMFLEQTQGFGGGGAAALEGEAQPPSLFELMMQERMGSGIKPALEYLVHTITESYPHVSTALPVRYFEESYALLRFFMERYFLSRYDSLATEKFYGMKRVMFRAAEQEGQPAKTALLSDRARKQSLLFAVSRLSFMRVWSSDVCVCGLISKCHVFVQVLVPYLKAKLDNYHKSLSETLPRTMPTTPAVRNDASADDSASGNAVASAARPNFHAFLRRLKQLQLLYRVKKAFLKTYPFAHFAYEGAFFLYQVRERQRLHVSLEASLTGYFVWDPVALFVWRHALFLAISTSNEDYSRPSHSR